MVRLSKMNEAGFIGDMPEEKPARQTKDSSSDSVGRVLVSRENRQTVGTIEAKNPRITCRNVDVFYGDKQAIKDVSLDIGQNEVISMIGPSGCGKSTFIRCLNRMNDTIDICRVTGEIKLDGKNIYSKDIDVVPLRAQVGMVFQKPNPFPNPSTTTLPTGPRFTGWRQARPNWMKLSRPRCRKPACGKR